jgi:hypothetical protein
MIVYIVLCNGEVNEVFSNFVAAQTHADNLTKKWNVTKIIERIVDFI